MITSIAVEVVELDRLDHPLLAGSSGPRICHEGTELGDGRHREPRQVSAVTNGLAPWALSYGLDGAPQPRRRPSACVYPAQLFTLPALPAGLPSFSIA
jgi:hypothetical protein